MSVPTLALYAPWALLNFMSCASVAYFCGKRKPFYRIFFLAFLRRQSFIFFYLLNRLNYATLLLPLFYQRVFTQALIAKVMKRFLASYPLRSGRENNVTGLLLSLSLKGVNI